MEEIAAKAAQDGNLPEEVHQALRAVFRRTGRRFPTAEAEDFSQEAYVKLLELLPEERVKIKDPRAYILKIALNLANDSSRKKDHQVRPQSVDHTTVQIPAPDDADPAVFIEAVEEGSRVEEARWFRQKLHLLSPNQRKVILLTLANMTDEQIAVRLSMTEENVRALRSKGKQRLRREYLARRLSVNHA